MLSKTLLILTTCTFILLNTSYGQCTWNPTPSTKAELDSANCYLARRFAPVVVQFGGSNGNTNNSPSDTPTRVNFDGDWNHNNNWENVAQVGSFSPSAYFDVKWTETLYIVTYYYYYPRDYADDTANCSDNGRQHEGDGERVVVIIEKSSLRVRGYLASNHGREDKVNCIDYSTDRSCESTQADPCDNDDNLQGCFALFFDNVTSSPEYYNGDHPVIYSSAGSHALYELECHAVDDVTTSSGNCVPGNDFIIAFVPGDWGSVSSSNFVNQYTKANWVNDTIEPFEVITYQLIDVFSTDPTQGLWVHRDTTNLFTSLAVAYVNNQKPYEIIPYAYGYYGDYSQQRLKCDTHCGLFFDNAAAAAPWNGYLGLNILPYLNNSFNEFNCCADDTVNCEAISGFKECEYLHNEYLCDGHRIKITDVVKSGDNVTVTFKFLSNNMLYGGAVDWVIWPSDGWTATGTGTSILIVTFEDATFDPETPNYLSDYTITATAESLECGEFTRSLFIPVTTNGLVVTTGDCNEIIIAYDPNKHREGNVYQWSFFGYDDLSVLSEGGKKNTFNTASVITKYNTLNSQSNTEIPRVLPYKLTVENALSPTNQGSGEWYGYVQIPHCLRSNAMIVYPNPAADIIHVELSGEILNEINAASTDAKMGKKLKGQKLLILNNMLQIVKEAPITSFTEIIDVSSLENGLYYLYTTTDAGDILSQKIVISR